MKWMIIFLLSFNAFAHEECHHDDSDTLMHKLYGWFSAKDPEVDKAPCKTLKVPTEAAMLAFINREDSKRMDRTVHGMKFLNEDSRLISAFRELTTAKDALGEYPVSANQKNFQNNLEINPLCDKVLCALEKIWGREMAVKMLYIKLKFDFNTSEEAFEQSDRFTKEELDDVLMALEDIPQQFHPVGGKNQRLTHYTRGITLPMYEGTKTSANAVVMLFDEWTKKSRSSRQYLIFHELAHNIGEKAGNIDDSPEWHDLSGWIKKGDEYEADEESKCFISEYAKANPWEDFAESISGYRYNGAAFKKKCPEKYEFIKTKVFKGLEYINPESCSALPSKP